jgi:hypothetical protein
MTLLTKPVRRETAVMYRRNPLVVTLEPRHLAIREKGRRDTLVVDYATIYEFCLKLRFRREQAEKQNMRRSNKRA